MDKLTSVWPACLLIAGLGLVSVLVFGQQRDPEEDPELEALREVRTRLELSHLQL